MRELILETIAIKRSLYQTEDELHRREIAVEEKFLFADEEQKTEKERELLAIEAAQMQVQLKIRRAHRFGLHFANGTTPRCSTCFVEHGTLPEMAPAKPRILGTSLFRCSACGHELKTEP